MIGNLITYDCQTFTISQYQKLYIMPIMVHIASLTTQRSELYIFIDDSLSKVILRKNELYFMGNLTLSIREK